MGVCRLCQPERARGGDVVMWVGKEGGELFFHLHVAAFFFFLFFSLCVQATHAQARLLCSSTPFVDACVGGKSRCFFHQYLFFYTPSFPPTSLSLIRDCATGSCCCSSCCGCSDCTTNRNATNMTATATGRGGGAWRSGRATTDRAAVTGRGERGSGCGSGGAACGCASGAREGCRRRHCAPCHCQRPLSRPRRPAPGPG